MGNKRQVSPTANKLDIQLKYDTEIIQFSVRDDTHMTSTLMRKGGRGGAGGGLTQK